MKTHAEDCRPRNGLPETQPTVEQPIIEEAVEEAIDAPASDDQDRIPSKYHVQDVPFSRWARGGYLLTDHCVGVDSAQ